MRRGVPRGRASAAPRDVRRDGLDGRIVGQTVGQIVARLHLEVLGEDPGESPVHPAREVAHHPADPDQLGTQRLVFDPPRFRRRVDSSIAASALALSRSRPARSFSKSPAPSSTRPRPPPAPSEAMPRVHPVAMRAGVVKVQSSASEARVAERERRSAASRVQVSIFSRRFVRSLDSSKPASSTLRALLERAGQRRRTRALACQDCRVVQGSVQRFDGANRRRRFERATSGRQPSAFSVSAASRFLNGPLRTARQPRGDRARSGGGVGVGDEPPFGETRGGESLVFLVRRLSRSTSAFNSLLYFRGEPHRARRSLAAARAFSANVLSRAAFDASASFRVCELRARMKTLHSRRRRASPQTRGLPRRRKWSTPWRGARLVPALAPHLVSELVERDAVYPERASAAASASKESSGGACSAWGARGFILPHASPPPGTRSTDASTHRSTLRSSPACAAPAALSAPAAAAAAARRNTGASSTRPPETTTPAVRHAPAGETSRPAKRRVDGRGFLAQRRVRDRERVHANLRSLSLLSARLSASMGASRMTARRGAGSVGARPRPEPGAAETTSSGASSQARRRGTPGLRDLVRRRHPRALRTPSTRCRPRGVVRDRRPTAMVVYGRPVR